MAGPVCMTRRLATASVIITSLAGCFGETPNKYIQIEDKGMVDSSVPGPAPTGSSDEERCRAFIRIGDNYKQAHKNEHCLKAAKLGVGSSQYSVGLAYGYSGDKASEEKYYRLAANNGSSAAYLALGHVLNDPKPWEAIYWYQRYVTSKADGYGYAALLVSKIFQRFGDKAQAAYWVEVCRSSTYNGCTQ